MTHRRQEIRKAIATAVGGVTSRVRPTRDAELPAIIVYALREQSEPMDISGRRKRTASVIVEIRVAATDGFDDAIDARAETVEAAMAADPTFGRLAANSWLASTAITIDAEPETPQGVASLEFKVVYTA